MIRLPDLSPEYIFKAVRSGGKGGQNVNKVSTKVELYFNISQSNLLTTEQKNILLAKLGHLLNEEGVLRITSDASRSQKQNKDDTIQKLNLLLIKALTPVKKRVKTKTPKAVKEKRLNEKKIKSEIKLSRRRPPLD